MSLPVNNKKTDGTAGKGQAAGSKGSKFIKNNAGSSKAVGVTKKVRSTGANRGS